MTETTDPPAIKPDRMNLPMGAITRLVLEAIAQAVRDAGRNDRPDYCEQARDWLETGALDWLDLMGEEVDIEAVRALYEDPGRCLGCTARQYCGYSLYDREQLQPFPASPLILSKALKQLALFGV